MRLFVALEIPSEIRSRIAALPRDRQMKWVEPDNLHLTLKFIGEQPEEKLEAICAALATVRFPPMEIRLRGLGWFPRVFWAGVEAPDSLARMAKDIEQVLVPLGVTPESRPYSPHLTLARVKQPIARPPKDPDKDFGVFMVREFILYQSRLTSKGAEHTALRRCSSA